MELEDGMVKLTAERGYGETHFIYLDPDMVNTILNFTKQQFPLWEPD